MNDYKKFYRTTSRMFVFQSITNTDIRDRAVRIHSTLWREFGIEKIQKWYGGTHSDAFIKVRSKKVAPEVFSRLVELVGLYECELKEVTNLMKGRVER